MRFTILDTACAFGHQQSLQEAATRFKAWLANPSVRPHPDIRETVYYYGMMEVGNEAKWQQVWDLFVAEQDASEKSKLMYGLASIQVPWILSRWV